MATNLLCRRGIYFLVFFSVTISCRKDAQQQTASPTVTTTTEVKQKATISQTIFPPSHDPSTMIRNKDGRYWIFTTGDGIWTMSASNPDFTDWRAEKRVFAAGADPKWIKNYVSGFRGNYWAPDVIYMNNKYYCYYSCAGVGAPAAIGVATASDLNGPWADQGMVVAYNNAIDPALLMDNGRLWLTWGNWVEGLSIIELSTSTGKPLANTRISLGTGEVEGPYQMKYGSYYYLFFQRGLCCQGLDSKEYRICVARSSSPTGPYHDKNGVAISNGGGTLIAYTHDRFVGAGHFGYGESKVTYHFYDGLDGGKAKLKISTLSWSSDGWPVIAGGL